MEKAWGFLLVGSAYYHFHILYTITHHKFIRQLWIYMSYLPLNRKHFDPVNTDFASVFGINIVKWADLRTCLQEHVYFKSSLVGVFSGQKMPGAS